MHFGIRAQAQHAFPHHYTLHAMHVMSFRCRQVKRALADAIIEGEVSLPNVLENNCIVSTLTIASETAPTTSN